MAHAAALAWTMPGFAAFDKGGADGDGSASANGNGRTEAAPGNGHDSPAKNPVEQSIAGANGATDAAAAGDGGPRAAVPAVDPGDGHDAGGVTEVPEFLRRVS